MRPRASVRALVALLAAIAAACSNQPGRATPDEAVTRPLRPATGADIVAIPAGRYPIGRDSGPPSQRPAHSVELAAFGIERTEVTNAAFAEFLNALRLPVRGSFAPGGIAARNGNAEALHLLRTPSGAAAAVSYIELDDGDAQIALVEGRFVPVVGLARHPVTEVTWQGARAYCRWQGGDLPSEIQWEAAARGFGDRRFPWGDATPERHLMVSGGPVGNTAPVGSRPAGASPFGVLDMAGSLAEWTTSLKRSWPYRSGDGREDGAAPGERTTRGGDYEYNDQPVNFSVSFRDGFSNDPVHGHRHVGFRCVWPVAPGPASR